MYESCHYIHYIPRRIVSRFPSSISAPWFSEFTEFGTGFTGPRYHVSRSQYGPATRVKSGDIIWLVSQLYHSTWGALPPSLDAKIEVDSVIKIDGMFKYSAGAASEWFPLVNMNNVLQNLTTANINQEESLLLSKESQSVGRALQSMRQLNDTHLLLEEWATLVKNMSVDFISYRIVDGTKLAFEKVGELLDAKRSIFWDRWSLPRRLAERRELVNDIDLNNHILKELDRSEVVWGIETQKYSEPGSYSFVEYNRAKALGKYRPA